MQTLEEIKTAIAQLPPQEIEMVQEWLAERAEKKWDDQIAEDERSGRLDYLIDRALKEHRDARAQP